MPELAAEAIVADFVEQFGKDVGWATGTIMLPADGSAFRMKCYAIGTRGEGRARLSTATYHFTGIYRETATGPSHRARSRPTFAIKGRGDGCRQTI